ncbi:hypothetical protein Taro_016349 [Colocasia esculenta]|uniref:Uncharacterized protein n=1 Tax=Colocasia esculenta TaxID=4460 RepID=A0A843UNK4_COLES|nr:hypothetical protein [Colocasia esculenta]
MVDGDDKSDMRYLYEAMDKAKEHLRERNSKAYRKWWAIIDKRWEMTFHHVLHVVGYFFNPIFQYKDNVERYRMKLGIYGAYGMRCAIQRLILELRKSTTQLDPKRKKDKGKTKTKSHKKKRTEKPRRKSQDRTEDSPEETLVGEPFSEAPPLSPHLAKLYEAKQKHYQCRRKMLKKGKAVESDESTQSPDDDDGTIVGTGATGGYGLGYPSRI